MQAQAFILPSQDRPRALNVLGTHITVLADNARTQAHEITLQEGLEGSGPPPHTHPWHESFYVIRGQVQFHCAGRDVIAGPGTLVHVPAGTVHGFRYGAGGGSMLEIAGAGAAATAMFTALSDELPPGPPDLSSVVDLLRRFRVEVAAS
jgi:quercetin dioxygenase-like cupin family protein